MITKRHFVLAFALFVTLGSVAFVFKEAGGPAYQRRLRLDYEKTNNIEQVRSALSRFATDNKRLPDSLEELLMKNWAPKDEVDAKRKIHEGFEYRVTSEKEFELCVNYNEENPYRSSSRVYDCLSPAVHGAGRECYRYELRDRNTYGPDKYREAQISCLK